jgi:hypothetical protein
MNPVFPNGWLAFELGVLKRLRFSSVAMPFTGEPELGVQVRYWKVRVSANDPMLWSVTKVMALLENPSERLNERDFATLLEDAYIPRDRLDNPALLKWFNENDAWWFDTVRFNAERLESSLKRAIALTLGMMVGDYVLSFDEQTRQLRQPFSLSKVLRQMAELLPPPFDNTLRSRAYNQDSRSFLAERQHTDLLFLRLPTPSFQMEPGPEGQTAWREEWIRGGDDFWRDLESSRAGKLGSRVQSKQQYLGFVEDLLRTAAHIPSWAISHTENGFISTEELVETVSKMRSVKAIYSKDFSDLLGVRASMITAAS